MVIHTSYSYPCYDKFQHYFYLVRKPSHQEIKKKKQISPEPTSSRRVKQNPLELGFQFLMGLQRCHSTLYPLTGRWEQCLCSRNESGCPGNGGCIIFLVVVLLCFASFAHKLQAPVDHLAGWRLNYFSLLKSTDQDPIKVAFLLPREVIRVILHAWSVESDSLRTNGL